MPVQGYEALTNTGLGYYPYLQVEWRERLRRKLALNAIVSGEAGVSKTYTAIFQARLLSRKFWIEDIVLDYSEYMRCILDTRKKRVPIMFDEPQYDTGKHQWMKQRTRALINTIMSQRFRQRPLFIPIINASLLDKSLRTYLVQYHGVMMDRGKGVYYRLSPSQTEDKIYRYRICRVEYGLIDNNLCAEESCLDCHRLPECQLLRAQYERKKAVIQNERDRRSEEENAREEGRSVADSELTNYLHDHSAELRDENGKISVPLIQKLLRDKRKIKIGKNRGYELRTQLYYDHPEYAPKLVDKKPDTEEQS